VNTLALLKKFKLQVYSFVWGGGWGVARVGFSLKVKFIVGILNLPKNIFNRAEYPV